MQPDDVIAILVSDIHLSHKQPVCRANVDWYETMGGYLDQLRDMGDRYHAPIIFAGDLFDKWNAPAELVNFAMDRLPRMHCIPGQHDLAHHNYEDIKKTAYWTLCESGHIINLGAYAVPYVFRNQSLDITAFPWGRTVKPFFADLSYDVNFPEEEPETGDVHLAIIHQYCWMEGYSYPGASDSGNATTLGKQLKGYDCALFGDNHKHFQTRSGKCNIWNNGGFMIRKSDEIDMMRPCIGLLMRNGKVRPHYLDTSNDVFFEDAVTFSSDEREFKDLLHELSSLGEGDLDFKEYVKRHLRDNKVTPNIQAIINQAMQ